MRTTLAMMVLMVVMVMAVGCTTYYKVTDPHSNKTYYTTELKRDDGSTTLKDARTGNMVTIQNSEVDTVTKEEFESGKVQPPAASQMPAEKSSTDTNPFK